MIADFEYYKNTYKGIAITKEADYAFYGERASERLEVYESMLQAVLVSHETLKRCACNVADTLYSYGKQGNVASENVQGKYSVSYTATDEQQVNNKINNAVKLYLGKYLTGYGSLLK